MSNLPSPTPDPSSGTEPPVDDVADVIGDLQGDPDSAGALRRLTAALASAARGAGAKAVATGQWMAPTLVDLAPRIPIRDLALLQRDHGGLSGAALAGELIRRSSRASAAVGAASGAMVGTTALVPPAWFTIPFELVVDTLAVAVIELKLVGELHEVYGRPVQGTPAERTMLLVRAWAERRGVTPATLTRRGGVADALGRTTRNEMVRMVRRRLMVRMGRNLSTLAPLLAGAVAGAEVNRRATRALGEAVVRDLAAVRVSRP